MALSTHDQSRIREYLLGHLNDEELGQLEERLIVDDDLSEELEISKGELIEEYCAGELTAKERKWFERHYLASREGRQQYALAVGITCLSRKTPQPGPGWLERLRSFLTLHTWVVVTSATAAVLIIAVAGVWISRSRSGTVVSFALTSTAIRRGPINSEIYKVKLNRNVTELRILLTLPDHTPPGARYRAELDDGRNTKAVTVIGQEGNSVVVSVPAADVPIGYYALRVFSTPPGGSEQQLPGDYRFIIE
jgi:hypothetical protein